ncbi:MAG: hypothetical protein H6739_41640 [Alphaproteobacteria bacterium]|nr:hypothetical protein [Alphaproteobacteria bacterium]
MRLQPLALLLAACSGGPVKAPPDDSAPPVETGQPGDDTDEADDTGDTAATWQALPDACEAPAPLPDDPLAIIGQLMLTQEQRGGFFVELIDLEVDGDLVYAVGQGGLMIYDIADPAAPALIGRFAYGQEGRFHRVELLGGGLLALTHRDNALSIIDASDPTAPVSLIEVVEKGFEGLAALPGHVVVTMRDEGVRVYDLSDPSSPQRVGAAEGLSTPWDLTPVVDGWTYAADNTLGVVPVDVSTPSAPTIGAPVALDGATLHVAVDGGWLYASQGSGGVVVLDRSDPAAPVPVATVNTGGSAVMSAASEGLLWVVDHEAVSVFDVSDPTHPAPLAYETTEQFALAVRAEGTRAWVGDWNILSGWQLDPAASAGQLDLASETVTVPLEGGSATLSTANRGNADVRLVGATVSDDRLSIEVTEDTLAPGGQGSLRVAFSGGEALDAVVCLASDDPDEPLRELRVVAGEAGQYLGQPAPDFALTTLDGETLRLSEQLGHPVFLVYFATW